MSAPLARPHPPFQFVCVCHAVRLSKDTNTDNDLMQLHSGFARPLKSLQWDAKLYCIGTPLSFKTTLTKQKWSGKRDGPLSEVVLHGNNYKGKCLGLSYEGKTKVILKEGWSLMTLTDREVFCHNGLLQWFVHYSHNSVSL